MPSQNRSKNTGFYFLLFFLVCVVLFSFLEIFLRIYKPPFVVKIKGNEIMLPTDGLLPHEGKIPREGKTWSFTPNSKTDKLDKLITVRQNSIGLRGEDPPRDFSDRLTLIAVGGSTTYNACISEGKTWIDVLGGELKNNFRDVWINNAGFNGHSTEGHILLMEKYITKWKPKIVLFLIGRNDAIHPKKIGIDTRDVALAKEVAHAADSPHTVKARNIKSGLKNFVREAVKRAEKHSEVVSLAVTLYRNYKAYRQGLIIGQMDIEHAEAIEISDEDKRIIENKMQSGEVREHLASYESRVRKLIQLSRDNNIDPVLITQPVLYGDAIDDVTHFNWAKLKITDGIILDGEHYWQAEEMINDVTRKVAEDEHVLLIDLARKLPKSSRYYIDVMHYSNKGNEVVADIIYDQLCSYVAQHYSQYQTERCN